MNLVSYEYVACQGGRKGVLVLSEFAGAAQALGLGRHRALERENLVLKRAVAVQARRLEATDGEKAALERTVSAQTERLRRAERTNYALSVHLHRASPGGMPDNRPPDVY